MTEKASVRVLATRSRHDTAVNILDAAATLFAEQGFRATTVKEITLACGITQAALYLYFPSKDAVLAELIEMSYEDLERRLNEAGEDPSADGSSAERLSRLVQAFMEFGISATTLARVSEREWTALSGTELDKTLALRRDVRRRFEQAIERGLADGEFTVRVEDQHGARMLATAIIDMCSGVFQWFEQSAIDGALLTHTYVRLARHLVGAPAGAER